MGINLKKLAKKNRVDAKSELNRKMMHNQMVHGLVALQLKGEVNKVPQLDKNGKIKWYWGLTEWFDESGGILPEFKPKT